MTFPHTSRLLPRWHRVPLGAPGPPCGGQQRQVPVAALQQLWPLHGGPKEGSQWVLLVPDTTQAKKYGPLMVIYGKEICATVLFKAGY